MAPHRVARAARAAADRLVAPDLLHPDGIAAPAWAAELGEPWTVTGALRWTDSDEEVSALAAVFHRAGRSHALLVGVDEEGCGAAVEILVMDPDELPLALADLEDAARADGVEEFERTDLSPAQFRWWAQRALEARAVHDEDGDEPDVDEEDEDDADALPHAAVATLLRAQLATLPAAKAPRGTVAARHVHDHPSLEALAAILDAAGTMARRPVGRRGSGLGGEQAKLPPKRRRGGEQAPV